MKDPSLIEHLLEPLLEAPNGATVRMAKDGLVHGVLVDRG